VYFIHYLIFIKTLFWLHFHIILLLFILLDKSKTDAASYALSLNYSTTYLPEYHEEKINFFFLLINKYRFNTSAHMEPVWSNIYVLLNCIQNILIVILKIIYTGSTSLYYSNKIKNIICILIKCKKIFCERAKFFY